MQQSHRRLQHRRHPHESGGLLRHHRTGIPPDPAGARRTTGRRTPKLSASLPGASGARMGAVL
ncbi:hypothetical protein [Isoptericola nanjingensis]|uniref:hypothetical protein n=1 Tax=Isoptericola nanjingensis TaxID=903413 RepID=UPI003D246D78